MEQKQFHDREHRFSANDLVGMKVFFYRNSNFEDRFSAEILDFSKRGLKIKVPVSLAFEEKINIKIIVDDFEVWFDGQGCIRHIREDGENSWVVGCSIAPTIRDEIISELAAASGKERRQFPRTKVYGEATIQSEGQTNKRHAYIDNLSEGGCCIITPVEIPADSRVKLEVQDGNYQYYSVDAVVHWQTKTESGHRTGCSFTDANGYKTIQKCVKEQIDAMQGKEPGVSRVVLTLAVLTMFVPPAISFLMQSRNESTPQVTVIRPAEIELKNLANHRPFEVSQNLTDHSPFPVPKNSRTKVELDTEIEIAQSDDENGVVPKPRDNSDEPIRIEQQPLEPVGEPAEELVEINAPNKPLSPMREWVDNSGQFRISAELITINSDSIEIRKADGSLKVVPVDRLSHEDLQYLFQVKIGQPTFKPAATRRKAKRF